MAQGSEPEGQFIGHFFGVLRGTRRDPGQAGGNGKQVLHPATHLTSQKLTPLFGL